MKIIATIFMVLIYVGLPMRNAMAEEVVNEILSETVPITGIYYDSTPLPDFPGGLFRFTATLKNGDTSEDQDQLASLAFRVRQLTNGNTLFNGDNGRYGRLTSQITAGGVFEWKPGDFLPTQNVASAPGFIQSNLPSGGRGNFEVVYRDSNNHLRHWFRRNDVDGFPWIEGNDGNPFGEDVDSAPAFIQSNLPSGGRGNFEVVYRDSNKRLRHWFRRNDVDGFPWIEGNDGKAFGYDVNSAPTLIQNRTNGNLEVVYRDGNNQLRHWFRDANSVWRPGNNGVPFGEGVTSAPTLIQSNLGSQGDNFEVVARKADNKLHHYFRRRNPTDQDVFEWKSGGTPFAENITPAPALIQSNLGAAGGNFEVVVQEDGKLRHYFRTKMGEVILKPGQEVSTQFVIGLVDKNPEKFRLFVDAVGIRVPESLTIVYLGDKDASFDKGKPENNGFNNKVKEVTGNNHGDVTFIIKKGLYRKQSVILDPSDPQEILARKISFIGEDGAVMSGAELLTGWTRTAPTSLNCWFTEYTPEKQSLIHPNDANNHEPFCTEPEATCKYREDLYINDELMEQVGSGFDTVLSTEDQWRFNGTRDNNNVPNFITACFEHDGEDEFNIAAQKIEISRSRVAFGGVDRFVQGERQCSSNNPDNNIEEDPDNDRLETCRSTSNIEVRNLIIEKYATPIQFGAIGYQKPGDNWHVENNEVRWNHAGGIAFGNSVEVIGNFVHGNGQIGIKTGIVVDETRYDGDPPLESKQEGKLVVVTQNVIEQNGKPLLGYDPKNEAGGTKFSKTKSLVVERNWVKDNGGPGLWGDINNCDMRYYCNVVEHNLNEGIVHELSYLAYITGNIVRENGSFIPRMVKPDNTPEESVWQSQIFIRTSSDTKVDGNYVEADDEIGNGITILEERDRNAEAFDYCENQALERLGRNNIISGNTILQKNLKATDKLIDDEYATADEKKKARGVLVEWYVAGLNGINGASLKIGQEFQEDFWATNSYQDNKYYLERTDGMYWNWAPADDKKPEGQRMTFETFKAQAAPEGGTQEKNSDEPKALSVAPAAPLECKFGNSLTEDQSFREKSVCLVAFNNENYVVNELYGYPVSAKGTGCDQDAQLTFEDKNGGLLIDGDTILIRTANNGYWSADPDGILTAGSSASDSDTDLRFQVRKVSGGGAIISATIRLPSRHFMISG